jgi:uncharacterized protein YdaL
MKHFIFSLFIVFSVHHLFGQQSQSSYPQKKILVIYEGSNVPANYARGDARQLAELLGHFNTDVTIQASTEYKFSQLENFNFTFYIGFTKTPAVPQSLLADIFKTKRTVIWLNTGIDAYARSYDLSKRYGFRFVLFDTVSNFDNVRGDGYSFTKSEPNLNIIKVTDAGRCQVLAIATAAHGTKQSPYAVHSGNFYYFGDSPFASATENDRYLLFADMLHDILGEDHPESHSALIRIEDVNPFSDPSQLRNIADLLSSEDVPFLVSLVPFYVDPGAGIRVSMSEKPDFVDAIHYMVEHGGTIVMHGVTHQYHGISTTDYEFWDENLNKPIKNDSKQFVEKKLRTGIEECLKNNIFPLVWETPHYGASQIDYSAIAGIFSSAMEQRLAIDDLDYSQYFPYIINKDLYGQKIYPENLGYVPLDSSEAKMEASVDQLIEFAKANLAVRDGFAAAFFHPFLPLDLLQRLVEGIKAQGYTFIDLKNQNNEVHLKDQVIASGEGTYNILLEDQFLKEMYIDPEGKVERSDISLQRMKGKIERTPALDPGWIYVAEPTEYKEQKLTFWQNVKFTAQKLSEKIFLPPEKSEVAHGLLLLTPKAAGGAMNDQESFLNAFGVIHILLDTQTVGSALDLSPYNLLIVPYAAVDFLRDSDFQTITNFMNKGGSVITDGKNDLASEFGVKFSDSFLKVEHIRDKEYPEELISWNRPENIFRFDVDVSDEVLCLDDKTDAPVAFARKYGKGRFIFLGARFDPVSDLGYSRFPYLLEHVRRIFGLHPLVRRDDLELYFEPGDRRTMSIEPLVQQWADHGVRVIDVAGWHEYPKWTYNYAKLISLCHANGILVYLWIEPPQISKMFWDQHPELREKNYKGDDLVGASWRFPVALTDSVALKAALDQYRSLLMQNDWDGINIAELYFEAGRGVQDPQFFAPFHHSARTLFQRKYGFDPVEIFHPGSRYYWQTNDSSLHEFENFRTDWVTHLHDVFLGMASDIQKTKPGFAVIVTAMDNIGSPELRAYHGVDIRRIAALRSKYNFTLQIEDPESRWSTTPRRYLAIGKQYHDLLGATTPVKLDLNILSFRNENRLTMFPTTIQTGIESYAIVHFAAAASSGVTIYSESSVLPQDLRFFPYALAVHTDVTQIPDGWEINSPDGATLNLDPNAELISVDGSEVLTTGGGKFLVPAGKHTIQVEQNSSAPFTDNSIGARLLSITGRLLALSSSQRSVQFTYESTTRCAVTLNRSPYAVFIDGAEYAFTPLKGFGRYGVVLPPGKHQALIVAESGVSYGVDLTSLWSSSLIVLFGVFAGGALVFFYVLVRIKRNRLG